MKDTVFNLRPGDEARVMQGQNFDGSPMAAAPTPTSIECAGGLLLKNAFGVGVGRRMIVAETCSWVGQ
jgi:hypothetical protein